MNIALRCVDARRHRKSTVQRTDETQDDCAVVTQAAMPKYAAFTVNDGQYSEGEKRYQSVIAKLSDEARCGNWSGLLHDGYHDA